MKSYFVEVYVPRSGADSARATARSARAAARQVTREGTLVRYVRTSFLPGDETCFHHFEAASAEVVEEVSRRAKLSGARVVPCIPIE